jgi:hypothetical protein
LSPTPEKRAKREIARERGGEFYAVRATELHHQFDESNEEMRKKERKKAESKSALTLALLYNK